MVDQRGLRAEDGGRLRFQGRLGVESDLSYFAEFTPNIATTKKSQGKMGQSNKCNAVGAQSK